MKTSLSVPRKKQKATLGIRKCRRLQQKSSLRKEYKKLRSLLPADSKEPELLRHKVGVVDAAYQYIRQLQSALLDKFSSRGIPPDLASVVGNKVTSAEDVQALALYLIRQNNGMTDATNDKGPENSSQSFASAGDTDGGSDSHSDDEQDDVKDANNNSDRNTHSGHSTPSESTESSSTEEDSGVAETSSGNVNISDHETD